MRPRIRSLVLSLTGLAMLAVIGSIAPPSSSASAPYASALASFGVTTSRAATGCNNKACSNASHGLKFTCVDSAGTSCKTVNGGKDCSVSSC